MAGQEAAEGLVAAAADEIMGLGRGGNVPGGPNALQQNGPRQRLHLGQGQHSAGQGTSAAQSSAPSGQGQRVAGQSGAAAAPAGQGRGVRQQQRGQEGTSRPRVVAVPRILQAEDEALQQQPRQSAAAPRPGVGPGRAELPKQPRREGASGRAQPQQQPRQGDKADIGDAADGDESDGAQAGPSGSGRGRGRGGRGLTRDQLDHRRKDMNKAAHANHNRKEKAFKKQTLP